jgi:hypothetical protein
MSHQLASESVSHTSSAQHDTVDRPEMLWSDQVWRDRLLSDSRLIVQIGQDDQQALSTLYDRYAALIYTTVLQLTNDQAVAEIILQDVFYTVWQSASSFQIGRSVPMWLMDMARQYVQAGTEGNRSLAERLRTERKL